MKTKMLPLIILMSITLFLFTCESPEEDDVTAPEAPTNLVSDPNLSVDGRAYISWTAPSDDDVSTYRIYRDTNTGTFTEISNGSGITYSESGLDYDIAYSYKVTAEDDSGNESTFSNTIIVTPYNQLSPATPTGLEVEAHNIVVDLELNVELTWVANSETDFAYYKIYKSDASPSFIANETSFLDSVTGIYHLDEDVTPGTTYHYKIIAYDLGGFDSDPTFVKSDTPLEVPTLTRPTDLEENISLTPTFQWEHVDQAYKYKIIIRTSSLSGDIWESEILAPTDPNATSVNISYPSSATTALTVNTRYFWFVAGYSQDIDEVNVYTETFSFRTQ